MTEARIIIIRTKQADEMCEVSEKEVRSRGNRANQDVVPDNKKVTCKAKNGRSIDILFAPQTPARRCYADNFDAAPFFSAVIGGNFLMGDDIESYMYGT